MANQPGTNLKGNRPKPDKATETTGRELSPSSEKCTTRRSGIPQESIAVTVALEPTKQTSGPVLGTKCRPIPPFRPRLENPPPGRQSPEVTTQKA